MVECDTIGMATREHFSIPSSAKTKKDRERLRAHGQRFTGNKIFLTFPEWEAGAHESGETGGDWVEVNHVGLRLAFL